MAGYVLVFADTTKNPGKSNIPVGTAYTIPSVASPPEPPHVTDGKQKAKPRKKGDKKMEFNGNRMTIVEKTDQDWQRSHIVIHCIQGMYYLAEFKTVEQLDFFTKTLGFEYQAISWRETDRCGIWREYKLSHTIESDPYPFWKMEDIPENAKPIKALSNGSIVTCYFTNDGEKIRIYRPNPNAHAIYKPLSIEQHIAHQEIYGTY